MPAAALIRKLEQYDRLSDAERQLLEKAVVRNRAVAEREDLVREGDRPSESLFLITGFAARYNVLRNGKRQITALHVPGDFVDLHSFLVKTMDHGVMAITGTRRPSLTWPVCWACTLPWMRPSTVSGSSPSGASPLGSMPPTCSARCFCAFKRSVSP